MTFRRTAILAVLCLATIASAAPPNERAPLVIGPRLAHGPLETKFLEIERDVPGFAGYYRAADGITVIARVKDATQRDAAIAHVTRALEERATRGGTQRVQTDQARTERRVEAREARFSFSELANYRALAEDDVPDGVYAIDINEKENVLQFGVKDDAASERLRAELIHRRIPPSAFVIKFMGEPAFRTGLDNYARPVVSGLGVTFNSTSRCSVGINATWNNSSAWVGFFTASHCGTYHDIDGTVFYQGGTRIGYEADDVVPTAFYGCPSGDLCRYADAAWVAYDYANRVANNGENQLALPSSSGYGSAGATDYNSTVTITGEAIPYPSPSYNPLISGDWVFKVGRTTGWTTGVMEATCEDVMVPAAEYDSKDVWFLCQERTDLFSQAGDSGSGVFVWDGDDALWTGILWGGPNSLESWHSSSWNVQNDFPLYTFYY